MRVFLANRRGFWVICEKTHKPSSPTHCVQMLSGSSLRIFSCCSRKSRQRTIAHEQRLVEFVRYNDIRCFFSLFYFIISTTIRRIFDFLSYKKEPDWEINTGLETFEWFLEITWTTLDPPVLLIFGCETVKLIRRLEQQPHSVVKSLSGRGTFFPYRCTDREVSGHLTINAKK